MIFFALVPKQYTVYVAYLDERGVMQWKAQKALGGGEPAQTGIR